jgi:hypothetical protein
MSGAILFIVLSSEFRCHFTVVSTITPTNFLEILFNMIRPAMLASKLLQT